MHVLNLNMIKYTEINEKKNSIDFIAFHYDSNKINRVLLFIDFIAIIMESTPLNYDCVVEISEYVVLSQTCLASNRVYNNQITRQIQCVLIMFCIAILILMCVMRD